MITIKECEEAGLCPSRALDTPETQIISSAFDVSKIPQ
jgi:hypothetical protein